MTTLQTTLHSALSSTPPLYDSHAHLAAAPFDADRDAALQRARSAGVRDALVPAVTAAGWPRLAEICASTAGLHPAYGLHPCYLAAHTDGDIDALAEWLMTHPASAVGECGLDLSGAAPDRERQPRLLHGQFQIARRFDLPLVLHARGAFEQMILELRRFGAPLRGVVHSFSGSAEQAAALHKLGFRVGIGGPVTYPHARRLRRMVANLPLAMLLLETDAPDQPGAAHRGQRNEPAFIVEVLDSIAGLREMPRAELAAITTANAHALFG